MNEFDPARVMLPLAVALSLFLSLSQSQAAHPRWTAPSGGAVLAGIKQQMLEVAREQGNGSLVFYPTD